jgi:ElaB/YqjD/DUF883 family membrane-anchored ribosome-binding protein
MAMTTETLSKGQAGDNRELREKYECLKKDVAEIAMLLKEETTSRVSKLGKDSVDWAKEHPGITIGIVAGIAAGLGFLLGLLVGKRS